MQSCDCEDFERNDSLAVCNGVLDSLFGFCTGWIAIHGDGGALGERPLGPKTQYGILYRDPHPPSHHCAATALLVLHLQYKGEIPRLYGKLIPRASHATLSAGCSVPNGPSST